MRVALLVLSALILASCSSQEPGLAAEEAWENSGLLHIRQAGFAAYQKGDLAAGAAYFEEGIRAAREKKHDVALGRFLANLGAMKLGMADNRSAFPALLQARVLAERTGDLLTLQSVQGNLASLYLLTGDQEAAAVAAQKGSALHPPKQSPSVRVALLISFSRALIRSRGLDAAEPLLREAYATAADRGTPADEAEVLELWGYEALRAGVLSQAEDLLCRAWVVRRRGRDPRIALTEGKLASLYRHTGQYAKAVFWLERTMAAAASGQKLPIAPWSLTVERAHLYRLEHDHRQALTYYRQSLVQARRWRAQLPPASRLRARAEQRLQDQFDGSLLDGYLRSATQLLGTPPDPALVAEMFAVIQLERSWSMDRDSASNTAPAHLYTAARRMEARWIAGDPSARSGLSQIRTAILEHESGTGGSNLESTGHSLQPPASGEAVLCYWLDDDASWLWLWTPQGLEIARLAPKKAIVDAAIRFRDAVASDTPEQAEMGKRLLHLLLGNLEQRALRIPRWNIVGDEGLFHIPYAALPVGDRSYLVEKVEVRMIPNALRTRPRGTPRRSALAIADPVLNRADERTPADLFHRASGRHWAYELPRLPGTAIEADQVLSSWRKAGFATVLHTGLLSTEEAVVQRFANDAPSVIHIATHTASPAGDDDQPRLVLSLHDDGSPGLLTAEDIASLRVPAEIVVLSACRSAGGPVSGHSGVFGLTRAWMVAGVRQVIATLWPIGDHAAKFQSTLHEHLSTTAEDGSFDASTALRQTQLVCLRMPAPFSRPKYWAGSVLLARR